jgi:dienelactone hydrolase
MGGRTALRLAGEPGVRGVVGLAPWIPDGEPLAPVAGRRVVLVHGTADRMTDPALTERYADRARAAGADVTLELIPGGRHGMLRPAGRWHDLAAVGALDVLGLLEPASVAPRPAPRAQP